MTTGAEVRNLATSDLEDALALSSASGWNQRLDDWRMLLTLAPAGSFAAVHGGRIVGTAVGIDYGTFGWIAMMLVDPDYRGQGIGARLLDAAMSAVPPDRAVRLDATPLGRALYKRHGFEDETTITRHVARSAHRDSSVEEGLPPVRSLAAGDLAWIQAVDEPLFGARRRAIVEWMLGDAPEYAYVVERAGIPAYCFGRPGRLFDQVGPVVAPDDEAAQALVRAAVLAAKGRALVVDALDRERRFAAWLRDRGFASERPFYRMCRPGTDGRPAYDRGVRSCREFAILGPELG
jgi:GNAT superfamily N-acetyltransferase